MKKIALSFIAAFAFAAVLTACGSGSECPAYASANTVVEAA